MSEPFNIERGVLHGNVFSPVWFTAWLDRIFRLALTDEDAGQVHHSANYLMISVLFILSTCPNHFNFWFS